LRITDDILLRRSNSLRQGLSTTGLARQRRKSSLEDVGLALLRPPAPKIALNGSIGLEVTPPDDHEPHFASSSRSLAADPGASYGGDPQHLQGTIV
jgi:potassium channel subfamily T member 1